MKKIIVFYDRENKQYVAQLEGKPNILATGDTPQGAVGKLIWKNQQEIGIGIDWKGSA